jgi:NAD(P)-dependent dehydrogenase (short-subunit alcohol dehydrogenase family)
MGKLEGKVALITDGNSGIGTATARQFVNERAYALITGRPDTELVHARRYNRTASSGHLGSVLR